MHKQAASLADVFERALGVILARVCVSADRPLHLGIAYSGGLDSSALLHLASTYAKRAGFRLSALHVHHNISPNADAWLAHCQHASASLKVDFDSRRIVLRNRADHGLEQAARQGRYAALGEMCRAHSIPLLLTAHHQDDQAETVLLQLLRGSGVAGLAGMEQSNTAPDLLGGSDVMIARPLLDVSRAELEHFAYAHGIQYVDDESNADLRYARNALRHGVFPALGTYFPGFQQRLSRVARHTGSAQHLLDTLASQDLAQCRDGEAIDISKLSHLDEARIDNVLRHWFALHEIRMPSTAWLEEMRRQLIEAKEDARICVTHADCTIRRHRGKAYIVPRLDHLAAVLPEEKFSWQGQHRITFERYGGALEFHAGGEGIDPAWLQVQPLRMCYRNGGERLKPAGNRPTRSLKLHYQALGIPIWERERLPLVFAGTSLLFAAGIGMNYQDVPPVAAGGIGIRWHPFTVFKQD